MKKTTNILADLAWSVFQKVAKKLVIEVIPLKELKTGKAFADKVCTIFRGNYTHLGRLTELITTLDALQEDCRRLKAQTCQSYLEVVILWMKEVRGNWQQIEWALEGFNNASSVCGQAQSLLKLTGSMLASNTLETVLAPGALSELRRGVGGAQQILEHVQLLQSIPGDASPEEYLEIVLRHPVVGETLGEQLLSLGKALTAGKYLVRGTIADHLNWLVSLLSRKELHNELRPPLVRVLGEEGTRQLLSTMTFIGRLNDFPVGVSPGRQMLWLCRNTTDISLPAMAWLGEMSGAPEILTQLTKLMSSQDPGRALMTSLARDIMPVLGPWGGAYIGRLVLPSYVGKILRVFLAEFYRQGSWTDMGWRMLRTGADEALRLGGCFFGDNLMNTLQYARELSQCPDWKATLQWFAAHDQSKDRALQDSYSKLLTALLFWNIYQTFGVHDQDYQRDRLRTLAAQLNDFGVVRAWPQLKTLTDLLPMLPALWEAKTKIRSLPQADSWATWVEHWLNALDVSGCRELTSLRDQLENWLADRVMTACDSLVARQWGLLPGASAVPVITPARPPVVGNSPSDALHPDTGMTWKQVGGIAMGAGGITLLAALILYAIGKWRRNNPHDAAQGRELQVMLPTAHSAPGLLQTCDPEHLSSGTTRRAAERAAQLPVFLGMAGACAIMGLGGYLYYTGIPTRAAGPAGFSDDEHKLLLKIINTDIEITSEYEGHKFVTQQHYSGDVQYDYSGDVQYDYSDNTHDDIGEMVMGINPRGHIFNGMKYIPSFNSIFESLSRIKEKVRDNKLEFAIKSFEDIDKKVDIPNGYHYSWPFKLDRITTRLLNYISIIEQWLNLPGASDNEHFNNYAEINCDLWEIAQKWASIKSRANEFRTTHPGNELMRNSAMRRLFGRDFSDTEVENKIKDELKDKMTDAGKHSAPILDPGSWLHNKISRLIQEFKKDHPGATDINDIAPDTMIAVVWSLPDQINPADIVPVVITGQLSPPQEYSLMDIASGLHIRERGNEVPFSYAIPGQETILSSLSPGSRGLTPLIVHLQSHVRKMDKAFETEIETYRNNPVNKNGAVKFYRAMMTLRCMNYLAEHESETTKYTHAVVQFLDNEKPGYEAIYWGTQLSGVFAVSAEQGGWLLFSIEDTRVWHIEENLKPIGNQYDFTFPDTAEFDAWFLSKLPIKHPPYTSSRQKRIIDFRDAGKSRGIYFKHHNKPEALAARLFEGLMDRLVSDADTLIWTEFEQTMYRWLSLVKTVSKGAGIALMVAGLFTGGSIPALIAVITGGIITNAAEVAAAGGQALIVDTEKQRIAHIQETISAGLFMAAGFLVGDLPQLKGVMKTLLPRYRNLKSASTSSARSLYAEAKAGRNVNVIPKEGPKTWLLPNQPGASSLLRDAARSLQTTSRIRSGWDCVGDIMERGGMLSVDGARNLSQTLTSAAEGSAGINALFHPGTRESITSIAELIDVPVGQLVVVTREEKLVCAMVGIGNGRFAGTGYKHINAGLGESVEIITAEEVGMMSRPGGRVSPPRSWTANTEVRIDAGYPVNSRVTAKPPVVQSSRNRITDLLGTDAVLTFASGNTKLLEVRVHGAPAVSNYMDGSELYHAIRGAVIHKYDLEAFRGIETIRLQSCYGAWWGKYSSGQMLANFSGKKVEAFRGKLSARSLGESGWWANHKTTFRPASTLVNGWSSELSIHRGLHSLHIKLLSIRRTLRETMGRARRDNTTADVLLLLIVKFCAQEPTFTVQALIDALPSFDGPETKTLLQKMASAPRPVDDNDFIERCAAVIMLNGILRTFV